MTELKEIVKIRFEEVDTTQPQAKVEKLHRNFVSQTRTPIAQISGSNLATPVTRMKLEISFTQAIWKPT
jgi:hypothetical protein